MPKRYGQEEIDAALACLVKCRGNTRHASAELAKLGLKVPDRTLWDWANKSHVDQFKSIEAEYGPQLRRLAISSYEAATAQSLELAGKIADRLGKEVDEIPARDLASAQRNVMTSAAVATDKALLLKGEPTEIREQRSTKETLRKLKSLGVDVIDAEVVSEQ